MNNEINVFYVVAMHWWFIWCQIFVFFSVVEYAVAISWVHFVNEKKALKAAPAVSIHLNEFNLQIQFSISKFKCRTKRE